MDLTQVAEVDLDDMVYTTVNVIDSGRIAGTVMEDSDVISSTVAKITRNLLKGDKPLSSIDEAWVNGTKVLVPYVSYPA